jgi:hypothetical protein
MALWEGELVEGLAVFEGDIDGLQRARRSSSTNRRLTLPCPN